MHYTASGIITPTGGRLVQRLREDGSHYTDIPVIYAATEGMQETLEVALSVHKRPVLTPVLSQFRGVGGKVQNQSKIECGGQLST